MNRTAALVLAATLGAIAIGPGRAWHPTDPWPPPGWVLEPLGKTQPDIPPGWELEPLDKAQPAADPVRALFLRCSRHFRDNREPNHDDIVIMAGCLAQPRAGATEAEARIQARMQAYLQIMMITGSDDAPLRIAIRDEAAAATPR